MPHSTLALYVSHACCPSPIAITQSDIVDLCALAIRVLSCATLGLSKIIARALPGLHVIGSKPLYSTVLGLTGSKIYAYITVTHNADHDPHHTCELYTVSSV